MVSNSELNSIVKTKTYSKRSGVWKYFVTSKDTENLQ